MFALNQFKSSEILSNRNEPSTSEIAQKCMEKQKKSPEECIIWVLKAVENMNFDGTPTADDIAHLQTTFHVCIFFL